jgi:hypothetical protein
VKGAPSAEVKEFGAYVALDQWVSVLLRREGRANPWGVLQPEARVATAQTLVSLPGYRSLIALDSGLHLTLWGNLPEFSASPPVWESVVMLHAPEAGLDLDFTLDRGRVVVANRKSPAGPARVRVRFLREVWELELPDDKSEAALGTGAGPWRPNRVVRRGSCRPGRAAQGPSPGQPRPRTTGREPMRLSEGKLRAGPGYGARTTSFPKLVVGRGDPPCCTGEGAVTARARRRPGAASPSAAALTGCRSRPATRASSPPPPRAFWRQALRRPRPTAGRPCSRSPAMARPGHPRRRTAAWARRRRPASTAINSRGSEG